MESLLEKPKYSGMRASPVTHTLLSWFFLFSWFSSLSWFFLFSSVFPFQFSLFSSLSCWRFSPPFTPSSAFPVNLSQDEIPGALPAASHPSSFPSFILPTQEGAAGNFCTFLFAEQRVKHHQAIPAAKIPGNLGIPLLPLLAASAHTGMGWKK